MTKAKEISLWIKRLVAFLFVVIVLFTMAGCTKERTYYDKCIQELKQSLIDPDSLIIEYADSYTDPESGDIAYRIYYNAKNRFGGYVGKTNEYFYYDGGEYVENWDQDFYRVSYNLFSARGGKHTVYVK